MNGRQIRWLAILALLGLSLGMVAVAQAEDKDSEFSIKPWGFIRADYSYNVTPYEDYDPRYANLDANKFSLPRVWLGLDAKLSKSWYSQIVLGASRDLKYKAEKETVLVATGEEDDLDTTDVDESLVEKEVMTNLSSSRTGEYGIWVVYAFLGYKPFSYFGTEFGMVQNAYNTEIKKLWPYQYLIEPPMYTLRLTRSPFGDLGAAVFGDFPKGYGGYRITALNGEGKKLDEVNKGKAFEAQVHVSPIQVVKALSGLTLMGFIRLDREIPDNFERTSMVYEGLLSYYLAIKPGMSFSINGEVIHRTTSDDDEAVPALHSRLYSGWADFRFLSQYGVVFRYDQYDPNMDNEKDKAGYQDELTNLLGGFFYEPIKEVKLCLNYRTTFYQKEILDDKGKEETMQPDQLLFLSTQVKFN